MKDKVQLEKRHLWHPFTQMRAWEAEEPLFIESGKGTRLFGSDGRSYYDGNSSMWLNVHGHCKAEIDAAVIRQLGKIAHSTMLGLTHEPGVRLAAQLAEIAPTGLTRVFYSDDGSTAVEVALKMAYQYWRHRGQIRKRFVAHSGGYHGDTIGAVSLGGVGRFQNVFRDLLFEVDLAPSPAQAADSSEAASKLEEILSREPGNVAAVIIEPMVQMAGGVLISPTGYLQRVRELCDRYDVLLIFDEVATGFGRTGKMFASEHERVSADFFCVGKGLTGGYMPLAATLTTERVYAEFLGEHREWKQFTHGHSYTGNPLACAAALASLELFVTESVLARLPAKIECVRALLEPFKRLAHVGAVRQFGLLVGIELVKNKESNEAYAFDDAVGDRVCRRARALGLITRPLGSVITFVPPLCSTEYELGEMLAIIREAIEVETT